MLGQGAGAQEEIGRATLLFLSPLAGKNRALAKIGAGNHAAAMPRSIFACLLNRPLVCGSVPLAIDAACDATPEVPLLREGTRPGEFRQALTEEHRLLC